jgi:hypothetical protein
MRTQKLKHILAVLGIGAVTLIIGWIDWHSGFELNFYVFYFIPVAIAAWFYGLKSAISFAIICALTWLLADRLSGHSYTSALFALWNILIRLCSFLIVGWAISKINLLLESEKKKTANLEKAIAEIKILESFLSICCVCKKIRNEDGNWQPIESYISKHSDTVFSHGYCPECARKALEDAGLIKK